MNTLVGGGAKNGKSYHAQEIAKSMAAELHKPLYYLATMIPHDDEDEVRIRRHVRERAGWGFDTIEKGYNVLELLTDDSLRTASGEPIDKNGVFLLDATTSLLSNEMFRADGSVDLDAGKRLEKELAEFAELCGNVVFVSDYIYSDAESMGELTEVYRKALAGIDRALARVCESVIEVSFSMKTDFKKTDKVTREML